MATANQVKVIRQALNCGMQEAKAIADSLIPSLIQEQGFQLFLATVKDMSEMHWDNNSETAVKQKKQAFSAVRDNCELAMQAFYKHN